jgi:uncharacterized protein (DUF302 family)
MKAELTYGKETTTSLPFQQALDRVKDALKTEGFGVLCEIDVAKTLKEKLGAEFRPYVILGACNPQLAYRALTLEPHLGLLLPCNVLVSQDANITKVAAIDAKAMLNVVGNAGLDAIAQEVNARLSRVLEKVGSAA